MKKDYNKIVEHYENCFKEHGDNHKGVDWPNLSDLERRYEVMLQVVKQDEAATTLLDLGCGTAMLYDYMNTHNWNEKIRYAGADLGQSFVSHCQQKYPALDFYCVDIIAEPEVLPNFDYIVMNGVFTEKRELSFEDMFAYFKNMLTKVFEKTNKGIAFNVMSKAVDWERDDLFHLSADLLIDFMTKELSRNFVIRNDYGLYEYTTYLYK